MVADGYKETEIGIIPNEWDVVKLDNIIDKVLDFRGKTPKKIGLEWGNGNIQALSANNVKMGYIDFSRECNYASDELYKKWMNKGDTQKNDIVMTMEAPLGQIALIPDNKKYILSQRVILLKTNNSKVNNLYLYQYLSSAIFEKLLDKNSTGTTAKGIKQTRLLTLNTILPPLKEQEKIADVLSTTDDKIDAIASQIEKAETLKRGLQKKLFIEGIDHNKFKDTGLSVVYPMRKIPDDWELKKLSDITSKITDGAHFTPTYVEKGIPFLRVTDLKVKDLLSSDIKYIPKEEHMELIKRCKPEYGDILYSKNGTIGLTRIITWNWEFSIFVSLCLIKPNRSLIIPEYLKYYLTSDIVNTQIKIRSKQGTVTNLHLEEIRDFFITIPPLEEQQQIADILTTADEKVELLKAKKEKYETLKKGLLQKLLSGEVRV